MVEYKQDMPPVGGYAPIVFERVPLKKGLSAVTKLGIWVGVTVCSMIYYNVCKDKMNNDRIEMRCARVALEPMLQAEADRMLLKQLRRNRDAEERIMKNVEGWEVGKWKHSPVYLTVGPDEYFKPPLEEYFVHTDKDYVTKGLYLLRVN